MKLDSKYWNNRYEQFDTGWDVGSITPPLEEYFSSFKMFNSKILVIGAGNGYEVEYLHNNNFLNVYYLDFSKKACSNFKNRVPSFPDQNILCKDFFNLKGKFDLIIEQTFFCAIKKNKRKLYVEKVYDLLKSKGKLVGLLFDREFEDDHPPLERLKNYILIFLKITLVLKFLKIVKNSLNSRKDHEIFIEFEKKINIKHYLFSLNES